MRSRTLLLLILPAVLGSRSPCGEPLGVPPPVPRPVPKPLEQLEPAPPAPPPLARSLVEPADNATKPEPAKEAKPPAKEPVKPPEPEAKVPAKEEKKEPAKEPAKTEAKGKSVYIVGPNGKCLTQCSGCSAGAHKDPVSVSGNKGDKGTAWQRIELDGKVAFRGEDGNFLVRCPGCWEGASHSEAVFSEAVADPAHDEAAQWIQVLEWGGKDSVRSPTGGKYLSMCENCVPGHDKTFAFAHMTWPDQATSLWTIS